MSRLENVKRDEISHFSNYKWLLNWESFLTSDYWKSWKAKISACQTEKELRFYVQRLRKVADLISRCKKYGDGSDDLLIKKEEKRLENISLEDLKKGDGFADIELKEMSLEEIDENFGKDIDRLFSINYQTWTKEQLITEINRLKSENEQLKNNQTLTSSERQERLQQNQQKLEQIQSIFSPESVQQQSTNNNSFVPLLIGGAFLLAISSILFLVIRKHKKSKKKGA